MEQPSRRRAVQARLCDAYQRYGDVLSRRSDTRAGPRRHTILGRFPREAQHRGHEVLPERAGRATPYAGPLTSLDTGAPAARLRLFELPVHAERRDRIRLPRTSPSSCRRKRNRSTRAVGGASHRSAACTRWPTPAAFTANAFAASSSARSTAV